MKLSTYAALALALFSMATTYVIEEGGVEVGRWEEEDGRDVVEIITNDKPQEAPKPLSAPEPITGEYGYQWTKPDRPENLAYWKVSGRVLDILRLKPVGECELVFSGGGETVMLSVKGDGSFSGKLPQLEKDFYWITVRPPKGYDDRPHVSKKGSLANIPYKDRLRMRSYIAATSPKESGIRGTSYDIQIGLQPHQLTKKEDQAWRQTVAPEETLF